MEQKPNGSVTFVPGLSEYAKHAEWPKQAVKVEIRAGGVFAKDLIVLLPQMTDSVTGDPALMILVPVRSTGPQSGISNIFIRSGLFCIRVHSTLEMNHRFLCIQLWPSDFGQTGRRPLELRHALFMTSLGIVSINKRFLLKPSLPYTLT